MASEGIQEEVVMVGTVIANKIGTIPRLLSTMVIAAAPIYEKLFNLGEEEKIKIVFKFSPTVNVEQSICEGPEEVAEGQMVLPKKLEGEVSVLCSHTHPYLDKKVWMETKGVSWIQPISKVTITCCDK
jgi:hypothetical protein